MNQTETKFYQDYYDTHCIIEYHFDCNYKGKAECWDRSAYNDVLVGEVYFELGKITGINHVSDSFDRFLDFVWIVCREKDRCLYGRSWDKHEFEEDVELRF